MLWSVYPKYQIKKFNSRYILEILCLTLFFNRGITKHIILPFHMQPVESLSDDFLFPMTTSRLSYASSPESDLELSPGPSASLSLGNLPQLVKSNSDPSIATNQDNLDRDRELGELMPPPYTVRSCCSWLKCHHYHSTSYVLLIKMVFLFNFLFIA